MSWTINRRDVFLPSIKAPRFEQIANAIEAAVARGDLQPGDRLPTVRALAAELEVSSASVAVAYSVLARRGRVESHVGRGTFVRGGAAARTGSRALGAERGLADQRRTLAVDGAVSAMPNWRRRILHSSDRLRAMSPDALACSSSWPDPALLPIEIVKGAYARVVAQLRPTDLQYSGPEAHPDLVAALLPRLEADGVAAEANHLVVVNSVGQLLTLALQLAPVFAGAGSPSVAVEEPGYHTGFNLIEHLGHQLIGVETDAQGAVPGSLRIALERGAGMVLLTPRALNPTGASWTAERREALGDVLRQYPRVLIVEDDHFAGLADARPGSLFSDRQLQDRTIYARSYSKSVAPDLRMTVAVARGRLHALLRDAKLSTGGWTSRIGQRALAAVLEDPALDHAFDVAREAYAERRQAASEAIAARLPGATVARATDGLNLWVRLPAGCDAHDVTQNAAHLGVLVSNGEPFYVQPGRRDAIRLSVGRVDAEAARRAGELLSCAALTVNDVPLSLVV